MKKVVVLFSIWLVFLCGSAQAQIIYSDAATFLADLYSYTIVNFEDYSPGSHVAITGDEYSSSGVLFDSPLALPYGQLYVESIAYYNSNFLSVGRAPFDPLGSYNDDDMIFDITSVASAFGVSIVDKGGGTGESITVYGDSGVLYTQNSIPDFFGIIADEPITSIFFDEAYNDGDDIGYDDIVVGNPVPEPASLSLLGMGLLGLLGFRRKRS